MPLRGMMNTVETAKYLRVTGRRVRQFYEEGRLEGVKISGVIFFDRHEVESFAKVPRLTGGAGHGANAVQTN